MQYDVRNLRLASEGKDRVEWAERMMPVIRIIKDRFQREKPLKDVRISACLHVTTETANLLKTLQSGGAEVVVCASNPLSTQDDVAASLVEYYGIPTFALKGEDNQTYYDHIKAALDHKPMITMDDGADLISIVHSERPELADEIIAGTEETTTGVIRLRNMASQGVLLFPIISVNDAATKHLFDNRYGTGQSTLDGIIRSTNLLISGLNFVVCGYGWCGKGLAMRAKGMGANVIISEVDPLKALEAVMDGYRVMPIAESALIGDVFVTLTGNIHILRQEHFLAMKDGAIICNSGHFNVEIDITALEKLSIDKRKVRQYVDQYTLKVGKKLHLLGEGRLINLAAAEGHPAAVMDMSFANQALSVEYLLNTKGKLEKNVYSVPKEIDESVASLKLNALGIRIDQLTEEQKNYLSSWNSGT